jgi:hypothetical protein
MILGLMTVGILYGFALAPLILALTAFRRTPIRPPPNEGNKESKMARVVVRYCAY